MAKFVRDGMEFTFPDGLYTSDELRKHVGTDLPVPVVTRGNRDHVVSPGEAIEVMAEDRISFVSPMESGS